MPRRPPIDLSSFALLLCLVICSAADAAELPSATSPDGRVRVEVVLRPTGEARDVPHYLVRVNHEEIVAPSRLGIELADGTALGGPCEIVDSASRRVDEEFTQVTG